MWLSRAAGVLAVNQFAAFLFSHATPYTVGFVYPQGVFAALFQYRAGGAYGFGSGGTAATRGAAFTLGMEEQLSRQAPWYCQSQRSITGPGRRETSVMLAPSFLKKKPKRACVQKYVSKWCISCSSMLRK